MSRIHGWRVAPLLIAVVGVVGCPEDAPPTPTAPAAPSGVSSFAERGRIRVRWTDASADETGFIIGRVTVADATAPVNESELVELATVIADQQVFVDEAPDAGALHVYAVRAENAAGRSAWAIAAQPTVAADVDDPCVAGAPTADDTDGDGLPDDVELTGWTVRVDENGQGLFVERTVQGPTGSADADGDGLCDLLERQLRTDPTRADTDGDGLDDGDEVDRWGSSPINVDSDGDAAGNSSFYDGNEPAQFGTSPTLADTDGDGRSDFEEVNQNGTNALLADLPSARIELVGTVDVALDAALSNGTATEDAYTQSFALEDSAVVSGSHSTATSTSVEFAGELSVTSGAVFPPALKASASATGSQTVGAVVEEAASFSQASTRTARDAFESATTGTIARGETLTGATLSTGVRIVNNGTRTFRLDNLIVTGLTRDPLQRGLFSSVATLTLPLPEAGVTLAPGQSSTTFQVSGDVNVPDALTLLSNPSAVYFTPASFNLTDVTGANFAFAIGETTASRTATVVFDFGGERPLETFHIATNVERSAGSRLSGITLAAAMENILELTPGTDFTTAENADGVSVLTALRGVAAVQRGAGASRAWAIFADDNPSSTIPVAERLLDPALDFDALRLMPRDHVYVAFVADDDGDGLFAREEALYGTSDGAADSDGDGISDFDEIRTPYGIDSPLGFYRDNPLIFSSPTSGDADGDGLDDLEERALGTDCNRADTDGDGIPDPIDPEPLAGLLPGRVFVDGSVAEELPLAALATTDGSIFVSGIVRGADLDRDGVVARSGDPLVQPHFLARYDAQGTRLWTIELEALPVTGFFARGAGQLLFDGQGRILWLERLNAGAIPGSGTGYHLIVVDPDGTIVETRPLTGAGIGSTGAPHRFGRLASGRLGLITEGTDERTRGIFALNEDGTVASSGTTSPKLAQFPFVTFGSAGIGGAFSLPTTGCFMETYAEGDYSTRNPVNACGGQSANIVEVHESADGTRLIHYDNGTTVGFDTEGVVEWTVQGPDSTRTFEDLFVDEDGRCHILERTVAGDLVLRGVTLDGNELSSTTIPASFAVDLVDPFLFGDGRAVLYIAASSTSGFGVTPGLGSSDLVLLRNPALLFP